MRAARMILGGLASGYPSCCVYQFAADSYIEDAAEYLVLGDQEVAALRQHLRAENVPTVVRSVPSGKMRPGHGYVRCWDCLDRAKNHEDLEIVEE